jgi:putative polyhydroxyalkanoate system protein
MATWENTSPHERRFPTSEPMSRIRILRAHEKGLEEARRAIEKVARRIAERFEIGYAWRGHRLLFERPGVEGSIAVGEREVTVEAELSFWLFALRGTIEREIERYLDEALG